jgi:hypothetical protein
MDSDEKENWYKGAHKMLKCHAFHMTHPRATLLNLKHTATQLIENGADLLFWAELEGSIQYVQQKALFVRTRAACAAMLWQDDEAIVKMYSCYQNQMKESEHFRMQKQQMITMNSDCKRLFKKLYRCTGCTKSSFIYNLVYTPSTVCKRTHKIIGWLRESAIPASNSYNFPPEYYSDYPYIARCISICEILDHIREQSQY